MTTPPHQIIGQACSQLHPIGMSLINTASILAEIRDELPKRGRLVDLHLELIETLAHLENRYRTADEALSQAYRQLEHAERCAREGWTPEPLDPNSSTGMIRGHQVGAQTPAQVQPQHGGDPMTHPSVTRSPRTAG